MILVHDLFEAKIKGNYLLKFLNKLVEFFLRIDVGIFVIIPNDGHRHKKT